MNSSPEPRKFVAPEFVFGRGALQLVGQYAVNFEASRAFLVTDPGVIDAGHVERVQAALAGAGVQTVIFGDVSPNPRAEETMLGARSFDESGCDLLVAVGGGSPMDAAKAIGIVHANHRHILEFEGVDRVDIPGPPLICVPTTAGTASDVSQFTIVLNSYERIKIAIISKGVIPDVALIDPETTLTMDAKLTAVTGMDAMVHAMEAYTSNAASPLTDLHALRAIGLLHAYLPTTLENLDDIHLRSQVMLASLHAGLAFTNASLGAAHALAHSLGGYLDLPHGECNAVLLDAVTNANYPYAESAYDRIAEVMNLKPSGRPVADKCAMLVEEIRRFRRRLGLSRSLTQMGVRAEDLPGIAARAKMDPCLATNPRPLTLEDIETLYGQAL
ncbi:MAG: alcohol dehydrogenase-like regulatory protein ErcA [Desulfobacterales bacterium]